MTDETPNEPDLEILQRMRQHPWPYSNEDEDAVAVLTERIRQAAQNEEDPVIDYTELVNGVEFHLSVLGDRTDLNFSNGLHRKILGDFLGYISMRSFEAHRFMASALVVSKTDGQPSRLFFEWLEQMEAIPDLTEDSRLEFWIRHMRAASREYRRTVSTE